MQWAQQMLAEWGGDLSIINPQEGEHVELAQVMAHIADAYRDGKNDLFDFGQEMVRWLKEAYAKEELAKHEPNREFFNQHRELRAFFVSLFGLEPTIQSRMLEDYFNAQQHWLPACIQNYLIPSLTEYFLKVIEENKYYRSQEYGFDIGSEKAISDFVDQGFFSSSLREFREREGLPELDEEFCSKIFYKTFQAHFDSRGGIGVMEMVRVGKAHPKVLEKMRLMEEFEDIRAALLRLQLTGQISSLNYR